METRDKKVKIVATIGPASASLDNITQLIQHGVNVFRLNFSHGDHLSHSYAIEMIGKSARKTGYNVGIIADLQGPKIRTHSTLNNAAISVSTGEVVRITSVKVPCTSSVISIDYPNIAREIDIGQQIMINDGAIRLEVVSKKDYGDLIAKVTSGGEYSSHKGVNFPNVKLSIPSLTEKDLIDLEFIFNLDIQYIALSFVRNADDVKVLRSIIERKRDDLKIIAKIEKPEAAENISDILGSSDGIMVARGDLGVETSPYIVPVIQKDLIRIANSSGKIVIVATQMLDSMIHNTIPTRAESSDVANAIIDGTDAIMLSGETAVGANPQEAVLTMSSIAQVIEKSDYVHREIHIVTQIDRSLPHAICDAAVLAGRDLGGIPLCLFTISGITALYIAKLRYQAPVYAFSPDPQIVKMLSLAWNIIALELPFAHNITELHSDGERVLVQNGWVKNGDLIGIISGISGVSGATNSFRIKKIGEEGL